MDREEHALKPGAGRWRLRAALSCVVAAACLVWVLHGVRFSQIAREVVNMRWGWVGVAVVADILTYVSQGFRWQLLLRPIGHLSLLKTTQAIYAGLFASEVLPLRLGELVRAYFVSRWVAADLLSVLPSVAVERLFDAIWLALGVGLTAIMVPLPRELMRAGDILGAAVLAATGAFFYLVFRRSASRWKLLESLSVRIRQIGRAAPAGKAFAASSLLLLLQAAAFWMILVAYGLRLPLWTGTAAFLIVRLGTSIPNAPANVGTYQLFTVVALTMFGVDKTQATGFSLAVFTILTIPLWGLGFLALSRSGATLHAIRQEIGRG